MNKMGCRINFALVLLGAGASFFLQTPASAAGMSYLQVSFVCFGATNNPPTQQASSGPLTVGFSCGNSSYTASGTAEANWAPLGSGSTITFNSSGITQQAEARAVTGCFIHGFLAGFAVGNPDRADFLGIPDWVL
jgi:hypothetical protein